MDPKDEKDMKEAYGLQDAVGVEQADLGKFEVPNWKKDEVEKMRDTINLVEFALRVRLALQGTVLQVHREYAGAQTEARKVI